MTSPQKLCKEHNDFILTLLINRSTLVALFEENNLQTTECKKETLSLRKNLPTRFFHGCMPEKYMHQREEEILYAENYI